MKEKHGEYIAIYWDDDSDVEYVRGHVTLAEARSALEFGCGKGCGRGCKGHRRDRRRCYRVRQGHQCYRGRSARCKRGLFQRLDGRLISAKGRKSSKGGRS